MIDKFQSLPAITNQIYHQGYEYYLIHNDGSTVGYISARQEEGKLFLSKFYIGKAYRDPQARIELYILLCGDCHAVTMPSTNPSYPLLPAALQCSSLDSRLGRDINNNNILYININILINNKYCDKLNSRIRSEVFF